VGYWSCEAACQALGARLIWNPEQLCGELQIDSLHCRFMVGGEVIHGGDQAWQLRAPILYAENRLLLPMDFVELAADTLVPGRFRFSPDSLLLIQRPEGEVIELPTIEQVGRRTYVRWRLSEQRDARLRGDGASGLIVEIDGVGVDPAGGGAPAPRSGGCLWAVRPYASGTAFSLKVSSDVRAWRFRWRNDQTLLELTLSENDGDRAYRSYHRWEPPLQARGTLPDAPIALRIPGTDEIEAAGDNLVGTAICQAQECGRTLAQMLEQAGHEVILLEEGDETDWVAMANQNRARLGLSVRPGQVGGHLLPGIRIVTYDNLPGHLPLEQLETKPTPRSGDDGLSAASRALMRPWNTVSAAHGPLNLQFGRTISSGLGRAFPAEAVYHLQWPTMALEGLDLPGAVVYLGALDPNQILGPADEDGSHRLAGALAAAVLEFLDRPEQSKWRD